MRAWLAIQQVLSSKQPSCFTKDVFCLPSKLWYELEDVVFVMKCSNAKNSLCCGKIFQTSFTYHSLCLLQFCFFLENHARAFYKNQLQQNSILLTGNMLCSQDYMQQLYRVYNAADSNMSHSWCFTDPTDRKHFFCLFFSSFSIINAGKRSDMHLQLQAVI